MSATLPSVAPMLSPAARATRSSAIRDLLRLTEQPGMRSLAGGLPAAELLPVGRISEAVAAVLDQRALQYGPTEGVSELRAVVGARLGVEPEHTLVTTGSQQGIDLLARTLLGPGDVVVVEAPGYLGALQAFAATGAAVHTVPGDGEGMRTDDLAADLARGLIPKLCYVVSDFANPTGATLPPERRRHLAGLADRYGFVVIEDNPYGELRFAGSPPPPLRHWTDRAVSLGTASKVLSPGLRVGWLAAPEWLHGPLVRAKQAADLHTATLNQLVVAEVLQDAAFMAGHLRTLRSTYQQRAEALVAALDRHAPGRLELRPPEGGMFVWARLTDPAADATELLARAIDHGVAFVPGVAFHPDESAGRSHLRLCFTTLAPNELEEAVRRLVLAFRPS